MLKNITKEGKVKENPTLQWSLSYLLGHLEGPKNRLKQIIFDFWGKFHRPTFTVFSPVAVNKI